jgi:predicted metalloprotease with PDZ domain
LISFLDRLDHLNSILYEYHSSPARNAKNSRIAEEFWTNNDVRRLSYLRGCLLALSWDKKIKTATRNRYSLDDFMRALFYTVQADQRLLTLDDIQQSASQFFPQKTVKEDLDNYILNGKTLSTDPHYFKNCKLEWMDNIGFDLVRTQTKDCIQGVREGSAAYQAGLRDGCRLIDYQCSNGIVTLRFQGHEGQKEVKYPYDSTDRIPQYKLLTLQ